MSLRPSLLRPALAARQSLAAGSVRGVSTSKARRAGHDDHSHSHGSEGSDAYTNESFFSPAMRNSIILITASVLIWPYLPSRKTGSASPSASPSSFSSVADDTQSPAITRWLAKNTPDAKVWTERNDKHLELTKEAAEERLLFQEAERPRVWRLRNTAAFEAGSPHSVPVGSQVDLSDLKIKPE